MQDNANLRITAHPKNQNFVAFRQNAEIAVMSEQYIVSARKYRPQTFDTVVGQQHITTTLKNAISNQHLAHAYLFCGPRGVGKTTCARILARTINCEHPTADTEACGTCSTCRSFEDNTSFNIFELDAASNNSVDDIRALTEQVRYAPQHGKYKIYIIDEVHMLSSAAFNAFLKTLEEPPAYAIFILATTEKHKILPTILSRCQIFDFKRIQTADIVGHMANICSKESVDAENKALHIIAQKSEGCMRDALSMMDRIAGFSGGQLSYALTVEHLNILDADVYFRWSDMLLSKDLTGALLLLEEVLQRGFEGDVLLNGFSSHYRNLLLSKDVRMAELLDVPEEHKRIYYEKAATLPAPYILSALSILNEAELGFRNALNKRLHLELCLIRLCYLNDVLDLSGLPEAVEKKKLAEPAITPATDSVVRPEVAAKSQPEPPPVMVSPAPEPKPPEVHAAKTAKRPKLERNMLQHIIQETIQENKQEFTALQLDQELAIRLLGEFQSYLRTEQNNALAAEQVVMMGIKCLSTSELQLQAISNMNHSYALNLRQVFMDFCKQKTHLTDLRVTVILDVAALDQEPKEKVLSRSEVYELATVANPALKLLKEGLDLNIE